jgi:outer membrane lipoprotein-sorting protein
MVTLGTASLCVGMSAAAATAPQPAAKVPGAPARAVPASLPAMSAAQVVEKNVAARGGLPAWQAVQTISWKGKMGAGATTYAVITEKGKLEQKEREETLLPFRFEFKRPLKSRLELDFNGQTAVQVFDGTNGWKLRPYLGRNDWVAFSPEEQKQAAADPGIDGLLINYAAKGTRVESDGTEMLEGHAAYKLKVTRKDGEVRHVWIDGQSFLDVKVDGEPRKLDGHPHAVAIYLRDYHRDQGLMIPHELETVVQGVPKSEKITIESVAVNPPLDDARFTKPK